MKSLKEEIMSLVAQYVREEHSEKTFLPGESPVPPSGKVFGVEEVQNLVDSALEFWLTTGRFDEAFRRRLAGFVGVRHALTTNSGSSANLLAVSALTSPLLGERALRAGDEVITVASGFPTTVNPILQNRLIPVFVDVDIPTYNVIPDRVEEAIGPRTRAVILAHTLGNPFDVARILEIVDRHDLWLIEDCCDALGATYDDQMVGTFGSLATCSFYPAHHITMGEGGAVLTKTPLLKRIVESFRDWGRDCWCEPGKENTCGKRFDWKLGDLPEGYDHKYCYSHLGFNLKITDMQAAVALAQMDRLPDFIAKRRENWNLLKAGLSSLEEHLILPTATPGSDPSWFGFTMTLRNGSISRTNLLAYLDERRIGTRLLFGGNLLRQPYFRGLPHRVVGGLENSDTITERTFWIGVYPGIDGAMIEYVIESLHRFFGH
jgi:CDP-6-deoxy-D-xylo-4-hexulose-3-dehydrase